MKAVGKYNALKAASTTMTIGTPIATLAACSQAFLSTPAQTISATAVFAFLIAALFFKDKIAENFKTPTPLVLAITVFLLIEVIEAILQPIKIVCIATMVSCGIDELTFKNFYKRIEAFMPKGAESCKTFGFYFTTTEALYNKVKELNNGQITE